MKNFYHVLNDYTFKKFEENEAEPSRKGYNLKKTAIKEKEATLWFCAKHDELHYVTSESDLLEGQEL